VNNLFCSDCGEKMILRWLGVWSLAVCYECPKCYFQDGYYLKEKIPFPSQELINKLENMPLSQPHEIQLKWLMELNDMIEQHDIQSSFQKASQDE